jgi:GH24 family phage-related lysozyme (muramidase)
MPIITASVGKSCANRASDVRLVQSLLNKHSIPGFPERLLVDGRFGSKTATRIELFQKRVLRFSRPDGKVTPKGPTFSGLCGQSFSGITQPISSFTLSIRGIAMLKKKEALSLHPYDDQSGSKISTWTKGATIGYGHLIDKQDWSLYQNGVTEALAEKLFKKDLVPFIQTVKTRVAAGISQHQFDALVMLCFNIGRTAFANSSVLMLVNDPTAKSSYPNLNAAWMAWTKSQGSEMSGLINRRKSEWRVYDRGVYE